MRKGVRALAALLLVLLIMWAVRPQRVALAAIELATGSTTPTATGWTNATRAYVYNGTTGSSYANTSGGGRVRSAYQLVIGGYSHSNTNTSKRIERLIFRFNYRWSAGASYAGKGDYRFEYRTSSTGTWNNLATFTAVTTTWTEATYPVLLRPDSTVWQWSDIANMQMRVVFVDSGSGIDFNGDMWLDVMDIQIDYDTTPPATPGWGSGGAADTGNGPEVRLTWQANAESDLGGYHVLRKRTADPSYAQIASIAAGTTTWLDNAANNPSSPPQSDVSYDYALRAYDTSNNLSSNSTPVTIVADAVPTAPTGFSASALGSRSVQLTWNANTQADMAGYNIYRKASADPGYTRIYVLAGAGSGTVTWTDNPSNNPSNPPQPSTSYLYYVTAYDSYNQPDHESAASATASVTTPEEDNTPPGTPAWVEPGVSDTGAGRELRLQWTPPADPDLYGFRVYRSETSGSYGAPCRTVAASGMSTYTYLDSAATPCGSAPLNGITYHFKVTAYDTSDNESVLSSSPERSAAATNAPPGVPRNFAAANLMSGPGGGAIRLSWVESAETDVTEYRVYRREQSTSYPPDNTPTFTVSPKSTVSRDDAGLANGTRYYYVIKAYDGNSLSPASAEVWAVPTPPASFAAAADPSQGPFAQPFKIWMRAGSMACDSTCELYMEWAPVSEAAYYEVHASDSQDLLWYSDTDWGWNAAATWTLAGTATSTGFQVAGLTPYVNYVIRITAKNSLGVTLQTSYSRQYPPDRIPHGNYATDTNLCANCHQTHTGESPRLLRATSATALCLTCHNGSGSKYDVLNGQIRGNDGLAVNSANTPESPANAFGSAEGLSGSQPVNRTVTSRHIMGESLTNAPGSGGGYAGTLACISCHNPHGSSNYRILKQSINGFSVNVPGWSATASAATGEEGATYWGAYNPAHTGTPQQMATGPGSNEGSITLASSASSADNAYRGSFVRVTETATGTLYVGYIRSYTGATRVANVRFIGGSGAWPAGPAANFGYAIEADPKAGLNTLCQACHTSFALSRSGAAQSGVSNDGGTTHRYRHAIGRRVYQGLLADTITLTTGAADPWRFPGYAIKTDALHPQQWSQQKGFAFPWRVVMENEHVADWTNSTAANSNRIMCATCHFAHGTDRYGFSPVTRTGATVTETVETGTLTSMSVDKTRVQLSASPDVKFPANPRGLWLDIQVDAGGTIQSRRILDLADGRWAMLESAITTTLSTPQYTAKRKVDTLNPNDSGSSVQASTTLRRQNNMGVCQSCHQK